jgi:hypothetical protein
VAEKITVNVSRLVDTWRGCLWKEELKYLMIIHSDGIEITDREKWRQS